MNRLHGKVFVVILGFAQLIFCLVAFSIPEFIVGELQRKDAAELVMTRFHEVVDSEDVTKVFVHVGLFASYINGSYNDSNCKDMVAVFGFALISILSAGFVFVCALNQMWMCFGDEDFTESVRSKIFSYINKELLVKTREGNCLSGMSSFVVVAMIAFLIDDAKGMTVGASFVLELLAVVTSVVIHVTSLVFRPESTTVEIAGSPPMQRPYSINRRQAVSSA